MAAIFVLMGPHESNDLQVMARRLRHRGPEAYFETLSDRLSIGAIGDDPESMISRSETSVAVAAGKIYSLRDDSEHTEPQANLAGQLAKRFWSGGIDDLATIDGDFAGLICRLDGGRVTAMRDFFSCVPLFWGLLHNGCLAFASEYKAICALSGFAPLVDRAMLQYLQSAKNLPVGRTLLRNVRSIEPGITTFESSRVVSYEHFTPLRADVEIRDEQTARKVIANHFRAAMQRRVGSDEPIGLALSGGIDSIAMAFQLRSIFPEREIHTFTAGYGEDDPEMRTAADVAEEIGSVHHPVVTPPALVLTSLKNLVWHMEDPCGRSEALQLMRIGEIASGHVPTILSGYGADGLFAGMPRHKLVALAGRLQPLRSALFEIFDLTQRGLQPDSMFGKVLAGLLYRGRIPPVPVVIGGGKLPRPDRPIPGPDFLNRFLANEYQHGTPQRFERTFGASGVNHTSPFHDLEFVRLALTIDERLKIKRGTEKYIFRAALFSVVPEKFRSVPKHPQRMRYDVEFANCLDQLADDLLSPESIKTRGFFEPQSIERLGKRRAGKPYAAEAAMRLWTALATETWARLFLDNKGHQ